MKKYARKLIDGIAVLLICTLVYLQASNNSLVTRRFLISSAAAQDSVHVYLPLILKNYPIIEVDIPPCRWPHTPGSYTYIAYKWGNRLQTPGSSWRDAFQSAIWDWNIASTKLYFYYSRSGSTTLNTYWAQDGYSGYALPYCNGSNTVGYDVFGNVYYDAVNGYSDNERRAVAGHETGHAQSIGHIANNVIALMGYNPDPNTYFTPQEIDVALVNKIYP